MEEFDPSKPDGVFGPSAWAVRNPISSARYGANAGTVNNIVYVVGGRNLNNFSNPTAVSNIEVGTLAAAPAISVPVTALAFNDISVGSAGEADFAIENTGNALLTVNLETSDSQFVWIAAPNSVTSGQSATVRMRFQPSTLGSKSATLTIQSNDPTAPTITVNLAGRGIAAASLPAGQSFTQVGSLTVPGTGTPNYLSISSGTAYVTMSGPPQLGVINLATGGSSGLTAFSAYQIGRASCRERV